MAKPTAYDFYCEEAISGKTPVDKLYESDRVLAFRHTMPTFTIHIVIIPKEHIRDLLHLTGEHDELIVELIRVAQQLARDLNIEKDGARLLTNLGRYQDTPHLHWHLIGGERISYRGTVIRESLTDQSALDPFQIESEEYSESADWHLVTVTGTKDDIARLSPALKDGPWYIHFWHGNTVLVVFKDKIYGLRHDDRATWTPALAHGQGLGIPPEQLDFPIS